MGFETFIMNVLANKNSNIIKDTRHKHIEFKNDIAKMRNALQYIKNVKE